MNRCNEQIREPIIITKFCLLELFLLLLLVVLSVFGEGVEKVVDDLSTEDAHAQAVGHLLRVPLHLHVKGQDHSVSKKQKHDAHQGWTH